jgi:hypothetical protein
LNSTKQKFRLLNVADGMKPSMLCNNYKGLQVFGGIIIGALSLRIMR